MTPYQHIFLGPTVGWLLIPSLPTADAVDSVLAFYFLPNPHELVPGAPSCQHGNPNDASPLRFPSFDATSEEKEDNDHHASGHDPTVDGLLPPDVSGVAASFLSRGEILMPGSSTK